MILAGKSLSVGIRIANVAVGVRYGFLRVVGWGNVFGGAFEVVVVCSSGGVGRWEE